MAVLILGFSLSRAVWSATHADELFQQALLKESGERDLGAAIELYRQIIDQPGTAFLVVFESRLRMGMCLERLGKFAQAEKAFQEIVKDSIAPQSEFTQEAAAHLDRLRAKR